MRPDLDSLLAGLESWRAAGESLRSIAARLGRSPSTISREFSRNAEVGGYRATSAHAAAYERAGRPKPAKLATKPP